MISVFGSQIGEEEIENVVKCMKSQWLGFGKLVDEFEAKYQAKFDLPNFAMVDSGSNALFMAVCLLDLPPDSEIIVPSFTWVSCAQAVLMAGHKPVFCDVDLDTMNVTAGHIKAKISPTTRAVMVVHYAGLAVDMEPIIALGLPVIEDAAHAIDTTYRGQPCGTIGDVGIFSFDAVKNLTVGEGGGITARNSGLIERARMMRYCGIGKSGFEAATTSTDEDKRWWEYNIEEPFIKMLPTNIAASIGIAQLEKIDRLQTRRREIWHHYQESLSKVPEIVRPAEPVSGDRHSYFTYCIRADDRDALAKTLLAQGIYTTLRYHPLHLNPIYKQTSVALANAEKLNKEALSIPLHPRLTDGEVGTVISAIKNFYG